MKQVIRLAAFISGVAAVKVADDSTPVHKVAALLLKVRDQVQEDGAKEAATYDKFACFCKDEADKKVYYIDKSNTLITELQASITELGGEVTQLDADVVTLKADLVKLEADANTSASEAEAELNTYSTKRANLTDGVKVIAKAIEHLKSSRDDASNVKIAALLVETSKALSGLGLSAMPGAAPVYSYRSNDVIATLQGLLATFKSELSRTDEEFRLLKHDRNMADGARFQKMRVMRDDIALKQKLSASKTEDQVQKQSTVDEETADMNADQAFLDELTSSCSAKAEAWDERSRIRAEEITALTQAANLCRENGGLYNVNKKLVDFQRNAVIEMLKSKSTQKEAHVRPQTAKAKGVTLLQTRDGDGHFGAFVRFLSARAVSLHSDELKQLVKIVSATHRSAPVDHFVEVRTIIKELVSRLEAEASDEATQKSFCDTQMKSAVEKRDARTADMETAGAGMDETEARIKTLEDDIATASAEIAEMYKAQKEMDDLRADEKASNDKSMADAEAGVQAIEQAIEILQEFYEQYEFVQKQASEYDPPGGDRDGKTVADVAPDTFKTDESYRGKQAESKGIIGLLNVIKSDFERTHDNTEGNEKDAEDKWKADSALLKGNIELKEKAKADDEAAKETKEGELITLKDDKKSAQELHASALAELEKLQASCVDSGESYAERAANRKKEIEALKDALQMLEDWKN